MNLQRKIKLFIDNVNKYGVLNGILDVLIYIINRFIFLKIYICLELNCNNFNKRYLNERSEYKYKFMKIDELYPFSIPEKYDFDKKFITNAFNKGDKCFGVLDGINLANYGWYSMVPTMVDDNLELSYSSKYMYQYKGFTHQNYRGQRLHAIGMIKALIEQTNKESVKGLLAVVEINNFSSLKSVYRLGYKQFATIYIFRLIGKYFIFHTGDYNSYNFKVKSV